MSQVGMLSRSVENCSI